MKRALITGVTGQDGSYLAELLLSKGYEVHGMVRRASTEHFQRIEHIKHRFAKLHVGDMLDFGALAHIVREVMPHEVYNLAAQSFVPASWTKPEFTMDTNALGVVRILEAIRLVAPEARFYQASSSEMFGMVREVPQRETTPFYPRSPYGVSKVAAHWYTVNSRESHGLFACSGVLFNHESPRRGLEFVTRKITHAVARIKHGLQDVLELGDMTAKRDWGFAGDYVEAMWLMLQHDRPDDYVVATGEMHSVAEFVKVAFEHVGLDWREHVVRNERFMRPAEVKQLQGDASKAERVLGWHRKINFHELVTMMVEKDMELAEKQKGRDR